jgi:hypothetical protein
MNIHVEVQKPEPSSAPAKAGLLRRILAFLAKVLSSPKGDQGRVGRRRAGPLMERLTISRAASCSPKTFVLPLT